MVLLSLAEVLNALMRQGVLKKRGSSIRCGWDGGIDYEVRGLLKLRTSFSSAREPIALCLNERFTAEVLCTDPEELYWLFDRTLLSFIINYISQCGARLYHIPAHNCNLCYSYTQS